MYVLEAPYPSLFLCRGSQSASSCREQVNELHLEHGAPAEGKGGGVNSCGAHPRGQGPPWTNAANIKQKLVQTV